mgnify:FL=1
MRILVANWKENPASLGEAKKLLLSVKKKIPRGASVVICPPVPFLAPLALSARGAVSFGVQNISSLEFGSYTGEYSGEMVFSAGARHAILGHSERRAMGEGNSDIKEKIGRALFSGLAPIVCIGEKLRDADGKYLKVLESDIKEIFVGLKLGDFKKIIIAYEPLWAIGKGTEDAVSPGKLQETVLFIRKVMSSMTPPQIARKLPIIYGGSVTSENAFSLAKDGGISGFLVGHESLNPTNFGEIARALLRA